MSEFKKETRYIVLKLSKLTDHQKTALGAALAEINLDESAMPECVVVEHDWPNHQETWEAIQAIVEGRFVSRDALAAQVEALRKALNDQLNDCINFDCGKLTDAIMKHSSDLLAATPQQHLAEIRADAAIKGWWACWEWVDSDDRDKPTLIPAADQYADSIRKGE